MPRHARTLQLLVAVALVAGACDSGPQTTETPSPAASPSPSARVAVTEPPFVAAAWPSAGSACALPGYAGRLGRIEALDELSVRFTLCEPDGAFRSRVAHPALAILDSTSIARIAADRGAARDVAGSGPYRIAAWDDGDNALLERVEAEAGPDSVTPTVILRWAADPAGRVAALEDASVDGIDAPGPAQLDEIATQPELVVTPRPGLSTAYLAFGSGPAFAGTAVRRAIAASLDRGALTTSAFPAGSVVPTHVTPCVVAGACEGSAWYEFNAPASSAALATAGFDLDTVYPLHVPDTAVPGLPEPARTAEAVRGQLETNIGLRTTVDIMPLAAFREAVETGTLDGLYLDGVASSLADATGFLDPLFGEDVRTTPARRAAGVSEALVKAAPIADPDERAAAIGEANTAIRDTAVIVPLAHPGSVAVFRSDIAGVVVSPLGLDPLGAATPGDRPQLVFLQATEPAGAYCGDQDAPDALRLCGLVTKSLYGFAPGGMSPEPALAQRCIPDATALTWTCRLHEGRTFSDGMRVDAGDVLASFVAQWDRSQPLRAASPDATFAAWDALFGGTLGGG